MGDTSGRGVIGVFIDGTLQLFQELINVQEITLSPKVRKWQRVWVHRRVLRLSYHRATVTAVLRHTGTLITTTAGTENWELDTLETHESLADVIVSGRVDCTTLRVSKELVKGVISGTLPNFVVVIQLLRLIHGIVDWAICGILGWASVEASWSTTWMLLAISSVRAEGTIWILISTRCSSKCLQVSDHCSSLLDFEGDRDHELKEWLAHEGSTHVFRSVLGSLGHREDHLG
jgi:hypothetical protein